MLRDWKEQRNITSELIRGSACGARTDAFCLPKGNFQNFQRNKRCQFFMILAVGDRCQFNAGPESSDNHVGNAMLLAWRGALGRHAAQTVLTCTAKEFARYSWKPVNIQSHSVCQARVHKYNSASLQVPQRWFKNLCLFGLFLLQFAVAWL